ncbi:MAG: cupin domain-containing protein [Nitrospiraceae bacterium]|nr:cupin domain-containing protein [Nitrospiraceae bacterium]
MDKVRVYKKDELSLKPAVPGAKMWAVSLSKSMLTYFEMDPGAVFPEHSHEAEQITMILEGEMTFSYEGNLMVLKAGDVIAIPSNIKHSATAGKKGCKAVDAWSPIRKDFLEEGDQQ